MFPVGLLCPIMTTSIAQLSLCYYLHYFELLFPYNENHWKLYSHHFARLDKPQHMPQKHRTFPNVPVYKTAFLPYQNRWIQFWNVRAGKVVTGFESVDFIESVLNFRWTILQIEVKIRFEYSGQSFHRRAVNQSMNHSRGLEYVQLSFWYKQ